MLRCSPYKLPVRLCQKSPERDFSHTLGDHYYYVNNNQTLNPGFHHEVHTKEHAEQLGIRSAQYVGYFESEVEAVAHAKKIYLDADGCAICCPKAHRG